MFTDIHLLNVPELDVQHNHTFSFGSKEQQLNYFLSKKVKTIENVNYHRKNNNLKVNYHIDELQFVNYVMINNEVPLNKWYYYFVIDRRYINENCTELILKIDVMQTYLFDYTFKSSLVERQHYNRYTSDGTVVNAYFKQPIDYNTGEYIVNYSSTIYDYVNEGCYIITSSEPLGKGANYRNSGSSNESGGSGGNVSPSSTATNNITEGLFVFIKAKEGFSSTPYELGDGYLTIGYGVTNQKTVYNDLAPSCTEEQASKVMYNILLNDYYMPVYNLVIAKRNNPRQCEVEAFADLCYNGGLGAVTSSPMFEKYLNNDSLNNCIAGWKDWYISDGNGTVYPGLITRRQQEVQMFLNAVYPQETISILGGGTVTDNNGKGYIPSEISNNANGSGSSDVYSSVVKSARKLIGKPYRYGGNYPPLGNSDGTDCSGLCEWAYQDAGIDTGLPHRWTTYTMYPFTKEISLSQAKAGDILYSNFSNGLPNHVRLIVKVENNIVYWIGAENEGIGIIESSSNFHDGFKIGTFRG